MEAVKLPFEDTNFKIRNNVKCIEQVAAGSTSFWKYVKISIC